jgi:dihydrofolate reductase
MPLAHKLYLTIVHKDFEADTFYPEIDFTEWIEIDRQDITASAELGFDYSYITYERKNSSVS